MATTHYDAIIVGAGQAGGPLSTALAKAGKTVAIIEREHIGGTCINEGCTPTKTMVASARVAYLTRRAADYGVHYTGDVTVDMVKVRQRKRDIVDSFRGGSERRIKEVHGDNLLEGEARFVGAKELEVHLKSGETRTVSADSIFLNVGEHPALPDVPGLAEAQPLTSTTIMELDSVPEHLLIIGGGYIALEFGQMFRRFGSKVTVVHRGAHVLSREDEDVADAVADILREDGITLLLNSSPTEVTRDADGVHMTVKGPEGNSTITGTHILSGAGRKPNTDSLNLAAAGVATNDKGYITVNDRLETNVPGIYALGDCKGGPAFTHISYDDYRIIRTNLIEGGNASITGRLVPYTVFIDPQLGCVGLNESEARKAGRNIKVAKMPMNYVARALEIDESRGFMKAIVDADTDQILGFICLGIEGGEVMAQVQLAMQGKLPYTFLRDAVFAHPTLAEALNNLFDGNWQ